MSDVKVYRIFGKDWSAETNTGEELDCNYKTEFVLKSDHDTRIRELEATVETYSTENHRLKNHIEAEKAKLQFVNDNCISLGLHDIRIKSLEATIGRQALAVAELKEKLKATYLYETHETGFNTPEEYVEFMMNSLNAEIDAILKGAE